MYMYNVWELRYEAYERCGCDIQYRYRYHKHDCLLVLGAGCPVVSMADYSLLGACTIDLDFGPRR